MNLDHLKPLLHTWPGHWGEKPFAVEIDGVRFVGATDGHAIGVEVVDELPAELKAPGADVAGFVRAAMASPAALDGDALREFVGPERTPEVCAACNGTGTVVCKRCKGTGGAPRDCYHCSESHHCECATCEGDGKTSCDACSDDAEAPDPVVVHGVRLNRDLLRKALRFLGSGELLYERQEVVGASGACVAISFRRGPRAVYVMPLRGDEAAPTWPPVAAEGAA